MMKKLVGAFALLSSLQAAASPPAEVWIDVAGQFDADRVLSGTFAASGAFDARGSVIDSPRFTGEGIHINRTMLTSDGEYLFLKINSNHVSGFVVVPTWCPPPETVPPGTVLVPHSGNWTVVDGTGQYATLKGTGSWATWVVFDVTLDLPVSAKECLDGKVQID